MSSFLELRIAEKYWPAQSGTMSALDGNGSCCGSRMTCNLPTPCKIHISQIVFYPVGLLQSLPISNSEFPVDRTKYK